MSNVSPERTPSSEPFPEKVFTYDPTVPTERSEAMLNRLLHKGYSLDDVHLMLGFEETN